jgi:type IV pilus assembly protein PilV
MIRRPFRSPGRMAGFNLIEVMIAVVLLSLGLLGMALLQSTALRAGQSSSERTVATMLAYQLLDMVRTNRQQAASYNLITAADFTAAIAAGNGRTGLCAAGAAPPSPQWQADRDAWVCAAVRALPNASGFVTVTGAVNASPGPPVVTASPGRITVTLSWEDDRTKVPVERQTFTVTSGL